MKQTIEIEELWLPVVGYEGLYEVSNLGNVRSVARVVNHSSYGKYTVHGRVLSPCRNKGYLQVVLCKNGKQKTFGVHHLVAMAFIPNPNNFSVVNHKDETRDNNYVGNLEWCTIEYNFNYGTARQRAAKAKINHPKRSKKILCVELNMTYPSINEAERQTGIFHGNIIRCLKGFRHLAGCYHWQYVND